MIKELAKEFRENGSWELQAKLVDLIDQSKEVSGFQAIGPNETCLCNNRWHCSQEVNCIPVTLLIIKTHQPTLLECAEEAVRDAAGIGMNLKALKAAIERERAEK